MHFFFLLFVTPVRLPSGFVSDWCFTQRQARPLEILPLPAAAEAFQAHKKVIVLRLRSPGSSHGCKHWGPTWRAPRALQGSDCVRSGHQNPCKGLAQKKLLLSPASCLKPITFNFFSLNTANLQKVLSLAHCLVMSEYRRWFQQLPPSWLILNFLFLYNMTPNLYYNVIFLARCCLPGGIWSQRRWRISSRSSSTSLCSLWTVTVDPICTTFTTSSWTSWWSRTGTSSRSVCKVSQAESLKRPCYLICCFTKTSVKQTSVIK